MTNDLIEARIARARAAKAAKLAHVARQMMTEDPNLTAASFEDVPEPVRRRMEAVADVNRSSDATWGIVSVILADAETHPDPFEGLT